ncbi:hypothetical protein B0H21DRAFT_750314, partial [Amylocystis lapponica]
DLLTWYDNDLPSQVVCRLGACMMETLRAVHARGVIHGDIHPGNCCRQFRFGSLNTVRGYMPTRRDDVESLAYTLIYLLVSPTTTPDDVEHIIQMMGQFKPLEFFPLFQHRSLQSSDVPDYDRFIEAFNDGAVDDVEVDSEFALEDCLSDPEFLLHLGCIGHLLP